MLTKLIPDQVAAFWPIIKYAVEESVPPIVGEQPDRMNRILSSMLSGKLEVWASYTRPENKFEAIMVTQFLFDEGSGTKNLLLYSVYGYTAITEKSWTEGFHYLAEYAKANNCSALIAYSANQDIVNLAKQYGGDASYTFLSIPLNKTH